MLSVFILCGALSATADQNLAEAVLLAHHYVSESLNHPQIQDSRQIQKINQIVKVLFTKDQFVLVQGNMSEDFAYCSRDKRQRVLAFVDKNKIIKICPRAQSLQREDLAQVLIHEAAHRAFGLGHHLSDECRATKWEVNIIRLGKGNPFANRYVRKCGLVSWHRYRPLKVKGFREPAISFF